MKSSQNSNHYSSIFTALKKLTVDSDYYNSGAIEQNKSFFILDFSVAG